MVSVKQAHAIVLKQASLIEVETIPLEHAHGRILRESLICDRPQPAFDKSTMDGIAVSSLAFQKGVRTFNIKGVIPAGIRPGSMKKSDDCFKIMTGAVVPKGSDAVIPIECVTITGLKAVVSDVKDLKSGWNIRWKGQHCSKNTVLVNPGCRLLAHHVATAASVGKTLIKVSKKPLIAILSTGDELVDIRKKNIKPYHVRLSNAHGLEALIQGSGLGKTQSFHLADNPKIIRQELKKILTRFDVVILSGGVSMGDFDYVPSVLNELKVRMLFHKVSQKPGKPFWFGRNRNGKIVFALPGNPVSTQMCSYRYVLPFLKKRAGLQDAQQHALLGQDIENTSDLTQFVPVKISFNPRMQRIAMPVSTGGSGDFAAISQTDGFVELPSGFQGGLKRAPVSFFSWGYE